MRVFLRLCNAELLFQMCIRDRSLQDKASDDPFETAELLSVYTGVPIPQQISGLKEAPVRFEGVLEKTELKDWVRKITEVK